MRAEPRRPSESYDVVAARPDGSRFIIESGVAITLAEAIKFAVHGLYCDVLIVETPVKSEPHPGSAIEAK